MEFGSDQAEAGQNYPMCNTMQFWQGRLKNRSAKENPYNTDMHGAKQNIQRPGPSGALALGGACLIVGHRHPLPFPATGINNLAPGK
jgi:hypothetical protein